MCWEKWRTRAVCGQRSDSMGLHLRTTSGDTGGGDGVDRSGEKPGADTLRPIPRLRPLGDSFYLILSER